MKLILRSDRKGLGKRGDIVEVSDGHARNFLLPHGHALVATDGAVTQAASMRRSRSGTISGASARFRTETKLPLCSELLRC